jgi:TetR/AcrR family transcriptional regulator, fatty acid metabolism regulator protein
LGFATNRNVRRPVLTDIGQVANLLVVQSEIVSAGQEDRSFIEIARRAQIIECAIDAIAELGYAKASLAEIAKRAGVSKGVISYHFAGKGELIQQVVNSLLEKGEAMMLPRVVAERDAIGMLRAYIEGNVEFLGSHHTHVQAVMNISVSARDDDGAPMIDLARPLEQLARELEKLLVYGQQRGEFREFSTRAMAVTIRSAIDAIPALLALDPKLDLESYAKELVTLFDLATRK